MKPQFNIFKNIDKPLVWIMLLMMIMGWLNIFSAELSENHQNIFDITQSYGKQLIWIITAVVIAVLILMTDVKIFPGFAYLIYGAVILSLVAVLLFGVEINASKSWFRIGSFALQPAEFAKYATALALARYLGDSRARPGQWSFLFKAALIIGLPVAFIFLQNDTGTALVFAAFGLVLFREGYVSGLIMSVFASAIALFVLTLLINEFIIIGALALIASVTGFFIRKRKTALRQLFVLFVLISAYVYTVDFIFEKVLQPHQKLRIEVLINEEVDLRGAGYNLHQSKIAIGSGGLLGKGYLQGTQTKYNFVPEQGTDFIFCTIGEEWGFAGSSILVGLFLLLLYRVISLAERQRSAFSRIYGYSVASIIFFHFAVNIGMTIGLVPVIGIPLPFFSYGGSSLWGFTVLLITFMKLDSHRLELL